MTHLTELTDDQLDQEITAAKLAFADAAAALLARNVKGTLVNRDKP